MKSNIPTLKNHNPVLVATHIPSYPINPGSWKEYLLTLELYYHNSFYAATKMDMKKVNDLMQEQYPGPYCVVEKLLTDRMVVGFSLEFNDLNEEIFWLLRWS